MNAFHTPQSNPRPTAVAAFQRVFASRFADADAVAFTPANGSSGAAVVTFDSAAAGGPLDPSYSSTYTLTWASQGGSPMSVEVGAGAAISTVRGRGTATSGLSAGGCTGVGTAGDAAAGFYAGFFNGAPLAAGVHAVIEDATCTMPPGGGGGGGPSLCEWAAGVFSVVLIPR